MVRHSFIKAGLQVEARKGDIRNSQSRNRAPAPHARTPGFEFNLFLAAIHMVRPFGGTCRSAKIPDLQHPIK
jgi:hypothetical protein